VENVPPPRAVEVIVSVVAGAASDELPTGPVDPDLIWTGPAPKDVVARVGHRDEVEADAAVEDIGSPGGRVQRVAAVLAEDTVAAALTVDEVRSVPGADDVVSTTAADLVLTPTAGDDVVARRAVDGVRPVRPDNRRLTARADDPTRMRAGRR
jgi:hypothetical protein